VIVLPELPVPLVRFVNGAVFAWLLAFLFRAFVRQLRAQVHGLRKIKRYKRALELCEKARLGLGLTSLEREELVEHMAWAAVEKHRRGIRTALEQTKNT